MKKRKNRTVSIIIPTWNNFEFLKPCLDSLNRNKLSNNLFDVIVINNGHDESCDWINYDNVKVVNTGKNLGWEGGINEGLKHTDSEFVVFMNDDVHILPGESDWVQKLLSYFRDEKVGAVGPGSNVVMGLQNIFMPTSVPVFQSKFLIGFCVMVRRSAIDQVGHLDETLPGGDDLDMSIRLRQGGYKLGVDKKVFIYHHGFKTGERVRGDSSKAGGWNSFEMMQKTNTALIKKHGLKVWYDCISGTTEQPKPLDHDLSDREGDLIRKLLPKKGKIYDLGCGGSKTRDSLIGIDMFEKGEEIDTLGTKSVADIVADVSYLELEEESADGIVARHILEHILDPITALETWYNTLKKGKKIYIAVPNEEFFRTIPMNIEHVHAYTPASLSRLLSKVGFKHIEQYDPNNGVSFIMTGEK